MSKVQSLITSDALDELQHLRLGVEVPAAAKRIWDRMLTPAERESSGDLGTAFRESGIVGVWCRLKDLSAERAIIELALHLNLADRHTANWLLRELGEVELEAGPAQLADVPVWNKQTGELGFVGLVVRQVQRVNQAYNVVQVLDKFQELGWPVRIDDPLRLGPDPQRLNRAVEVLNKGLQCIRFHTDGTGRGIRWTQA